MSTFGQVHNADIYSIRYNIEKHMLLNISLLSICPSIMTKNSPRRYQKLKPVFISLWVEPISFFKLSK